MEEEKIIEIAMSIVKHNDPLWTAGCLFSLNNGSADLNNGSGQFIRMVLESEYADKNILVAAYMFSKKYLDSLGIEVQQDCVSFEMNGGVRKR